MREPPRGGLSDKMVDAGARRPALRRDLGDAGHDLGVWQELPEPVRRGDEEFVVRRKASHAAVRLGGHADGVGHLVADAPRHGEAWDVRVGQPDARRPDDAVVVLKREDAAAAALYPFFFLGRLGLVVCC